MKTRVSFYPVELQIIFACDSLQQVHEVYRRLDHPRPEPSLVNKYNELRTKNPESHPVFGPRQKYTTREIIKKWGESTELQEALSGYKAQILHAQKKNLRIVNHMPPLGKTVSEVGNSVLNGLAKLMENKEVRVSMLENLVKDGTLGMADVEEFYKNFFSVTK